ncbi:MAG: putative adenylate/guanylate cyclase [Paenibacillus sp.]|jgi:class 3 adenylate cyclase|nr:putative adenylate/guanylate cyclase [Paenibacillus sp.]
MEVINRKKYEFLTSFERMDEILNTSSSFEEIDEIPSRDDLTYNNGFYVKCNAIFVDVRDSSKLPERYKRPTLAKIYRNYISEVVAIFNSYDSCKEINIVGDCVSAIFEATEKDHTLKTFGAAYTSHSLVNTLNYKLCRKGYDPIKIGIGIAKGRALMIQAGFKGSGINDVVWMGDVVNQASNLCSYANKDWTSAIVISNEVYDDFGRTANRNGKLYKDMFSYDESKDFYHGNIVNMDMDEWLQEQILEKPCP